VRIGIDATCWTNGRGYGRYTREIIRAMTETTSDDELVCFVDHTTAQQIDLRAPNVRIVSVPQSVAPTIAASANGNRSPRDMLRLTGAVRREHVDVFFSPSVYTYFPLPPAQRAVVAVHDAIAHRHPTLTLPSRRARLFWWAKVKLALWQARLVITVSDFAKRELVSALGIPESRIRVTGEAPASVYRPTDSPAEVTAAAKRVGLPTGARWFVYVGGFNPHKRVDAIVRAHASVRDECEGEPPHLLLVGTTDRDVFYGDLAKIEDTITACGTKDLVHWTGYIPDRELRHLHSGALALVLPSECEGFGLPAVEAAACGAPIVATTASPLPALLAGGGIFVAPGDDVQLAQALRRVLEDEPARRAMGARARTLVQEMSWEKSAAVALSALREVAA